MFVRFFNEEKHQISLPALCLPEKRFGNLLMLHESLLHHAQLCLVKQRCLFGFGFPLFAFSLPFLLFLFQSLEKLTAPPYFSLFHLLDCVLERYSLLSFFCELLVQQARQCLLLGNSLLKFLSGFASLFWCFYWLFGGLV